MGRWGVFVALLVASCSDRSLEHRQTGHLPGAARAAVARLRGIPILGARLDDARDRHLRGAIEARVPLTARAPLGVAQGAHALEVFAAHAREIGLVILDMGMPVMAGPECFARLRTLSDVPVLIATGYSSDEQAQALTTQGAALIEKPFAARELTATVGRLLWRASTRSPVLPRPS